MRERTYLAVAMLLIGGCTNAVQNDPAKMRIELGAKPIGPARSCVTISANEALAVMPDGTLGVRSDRTLWLNDTGKDCRNISAMSTLIVERHGSEICRGDHVHAVELPGGIPGPVCILGDFVPYRAD